MKKREVINLDHAPSANGFEAVVRHEKGGKFPVSEISKIELFVSTEQVNGGATGNLMLKGVPTDYRLMNSNFLDRLLENQSQIPENWKWQFVFFPGTVFKKYGQEVVRCLYWGINGWSTSYRWLVRGFFHNSPIAVIPGN